MRRYATRVGAKDGEIKQFADRFRTEKRRAERMTEEEKEW